MKNATLILEVVRDGSIRICDPVSGRWAQSINNGNYYSVFVDGKSLNMSHLEAVKWVGFGECAHKPWLAILAKAKIYIQMNDAWRKLLQRLTLIDYNDSLGIANEPGQE